MTGHAAKASVFKVPHHGSKSAYHPEVWRQLLEPSPIAVLTPWQVASRTVPSARDVDLILSHTKEAYITTIKSASGRASVRKVNRTNARLKRLAPTDSLVRLRRRLEPQSSWTVKTFGNACRLRDFEST